jgi:quercetin dioxygenase-like cupin family protein
LQLDSHTHPFDLRVQVARGSVVLTVGEASRSYQAGEGFRLARNIPHAERYGPEGATFWVARAH